MSSTARELISIEEFLTIIQTDERAELIEGEIVHKAMPTSEHSYSQTRIAQSLTPFHRKGDGGGSNPGGWWIGSEIHVIYEGRPNGFLHNLAGWRRDRHPERPSGKKNHSKARLGL